MSRINEELHRWLDGEVEEPDLSPEARESAVYWRRVLDTAGQDIGPAPAWLERSVMRGLPRRRPSPFSRGLEWLIGPRTIRVRPLSAGVALVTAVLAAVLLWPSAGPIGPTDAPVRAVGAGTEDGRVYVQFVYVAPQATSVAVAGDFNEWAEGGFNLRDPDGDGVWSGYTAVSPGLHKYMFVVDGEWVTDPRAERYVDDGFGNQNALISVTPPGSEI